MIPETFKRWPQCYLHVECCRTGEEWAAEIRGRTLVDLKTRVKAWIRSEFGGELALDGGLMPGLQGDYYAVIKTDGRAPDGVVCWESGGFYLCDNEPGFGLRRPRRKG